MGSTEEIVTLQQTLYTSKNPTRRWLHCSRRDWIISRINAYAQGHRINALEVGPGSGVYLPVLAAHCEKVFAADIEIAHLNNLKPLLRQHHNITLIQDNIKFSSLAASSFDLILCSEVIEHIEGTTEVLLSLQRLLKPGGILILSTPQKFSTLEVCCKIAFLPGIIHLVRLIYKESILKTGHINLMTEKALKKEFRQIGLKLKEEYKSGLYLPLIAECLGDLGRTIEEKLERFFRGNKLLSWSLWTQYYVVEKTLHQ